MKVRLLVATAMVLGLVACGGDPAGYEWANAPTPLFAGPGEPTRGEASTHKTSIASTTAGTMAPAGNASRGDDRSTLSIIRNPPPPPDPPIRTGDDRSTVSIIRNPPPPPPPDPIRGTRVGR